MWGRELWERRVGEPTNEGSPRHSHSLSPHLSLSHTNTLDWVRQHHSYRKEIAFSACVREREREWITCVCVERECEWENCVYLYLCVCGGGRWTACQLSTSLLGLPLHMTTTTMTATTHGRSKISKEEFFLGGVVRRSIMLHFEAFAL